MRKECAGRGMVHANLFFELFEEIRALEKERQALSDLVFRRERKLRDLSDGLGYIHPIKDLESSS
jgi:hypothetical protein